MDKYTLFQGIKFVTGFAYGLQKDLHMDYVPNDRFGLKGIRKRN